jgi:hypothetical protein
MVDARDRGHCASWGTVIRPSEAGLTRGDGSAEGTVSRGVAGRGTQVYAPRYHDEGLRRIAQPGCDAAAMHCSTNSWDGLGPCDKTCDRVNSPPCH